MPRSPFSSISFIKESSRASSAELLLMNKSRKIAFQATTNLFPLSPCLTDIYPTYPHFLNSPSLKQCQSVILYTWAFSEKTLRKRRKTT